MKSTKCLRIARRTHAVFLAFVLALFGCERKTAPVNEPVGSTRKSNVASRAVDSGSAIARGRGAGSQAGATQTATHDLDTAVVHVPSGLDPKEKVPLVIVLHGLGASSEAIAKYSDWRSFFEGKRIAWVTPDGPKDTVGRQFWNAGASCCDFDDRGIDHVAAFRGLVTRATTEHPIDPKRVYVVGYSNGGFMAHRIACDLGDLVAGVVSVAGAGPREKADPPCPAASPVRVLQIHGDADDIVVIGGGPLFRDPKYPVHLSAQRTATDWAKRFGCNSTPKAAAAVDFDAKLPDAETRVERFGSCKRGAVELWTVAGGNHYIGKRAPAQEAIWKFLSGG